MSESSKYLDNTYIQANSNNNCFDKKTSNNTQSVGNKKELANVDHLDLETKIGELEDLKKRYEKLKILYHKEKDKDKIIKNLENDIWILRTENEQLKNNIKMYRQNRKSTEKVGRKEYENIEVIKRIYSMYIEGQSLKSICDTLNFECIKTKAGGTWAKSSVRFILLNYSYVKKGIIDEKVFFSIANRLKR